MRKLFIALFSFGLLFTITLIVGLIPISSVGNNISKKAKKYNISISASSGWNLRLASMQGTTSALNFKTKINEIYDINGRFEYFVYNFINGNISSEHLSLEIFLPNDKDIGDLIDIFFNEIKNIQYAFSAKNVILSIYKTNEKGEQYLYEEILLNNLELINKKRQQTYRVDIGINKNKQMNVFLSADNIGKSNYSINAKIDNENLLCYIYDSQNGGKITCNVKDFLQLTNDFGSNVKQNLYKQLLSKKFTLNAEIKHQPNDLIVSGSIGVNNNTGTIEYNNRNNLLKINLDNIDLDETLNDISASNNNDDDIDEEIQKTATTMAMTGKENKIINSTQKKHIVENVNSLNKVFLLFLRIIQKSSFNIQLDVKKGTMNKIPIKNVNIDISKKENDRVLSINSLRMDFGSQKTSSITSTGEGLELAFDAYDEIKIKYTEGQIGNIFVKGSNVAGFIKMFDIRNINPHLESNKYFIHGDLKLFLNEISINDLSIIADDVKLFTYDGNIKYDFLSQKIKKNNTIKIEDLNLEKYFSFEDIYKTIYNAFINSQADTKQDAIFWKKLFDKRNSKTNRKNKTTTFILNNVKFYNENINNIAVKFVNKQEFSNIEIISNSDFLNGGVIIDMRKHDNKEVITSTIKTDLINLQSIKTILTDFENVVNKPIKNILFLDQDYNIPSFIGLNGIFDIKIGLLLFDKEKYLQNINGKIELKDGVLTGKDFYFKYGNGDINTNISLSLQGSPLMQLGIAASGVNMDYLIGSPLDGYVSLQCSLQTQGFNPYKFIKQINGKCALVGQNISIPNFDLLNTSDFIIKNGVKKKQNYADMIAKKSMILPKGSGNLLLENGVLKGDFSSTRELISVGTEFEYDINNNNLNKLAGSFVMMAVREKMQQPFPVYIPVACNGKISDPECLIDWRQFEELVESGK